MAEGADAVGLAALQLAGAGIVVDEHTIDGKRLACLLQVPGMGPHRLGRTARCLALAGIEEEHIVEDAVMVTVILAEVHRVVKLLDGVDDHLLGLPVVSRQAIAAIVGPLVGKGHRAIDIACQVKLAVGGIEEILPCAPCRAIFAEAVLVEHVREVLLRILGLELHVLVLHEHHESLLLALGREGGVKLSHSRMRVGLVPVGGEGTRTKGRHHCAYVCSGHGSLDGGRATLDVTSEIVCSLQLAVLHGGKIETAVSVFHKRQIVGSKIIVETFVTLQGDADNRAVWLRVLPDATLGGNSSCLQCGQREHSQQCG